MVMMAHWLQWEWKHEMLSKIPLVHGVILFFVLSGYLITRILLRNRDRIGEASKVKVLKGFYLRRFVRIFPLYYVVIFGLLILGYSNTQEIFPYLVTYTSNIYQSLNTVYVGYFNHFWSLAVEAQFYLVWPILILFVNRKHTFKVIAVTIVLSVLSKLYLFVYYDNLWMATTYFTTSSFDALGLGALLAYLQLYKPQLTKKLSHPVVLYAVLVVFCVGWYVHYKMDLAWYKHVVDSFLFSLLSVFLILRASTDGFKGVAKWVLENKFIVYCGKISYGLYVFHLFVPKFYEDHIYPYIQFDIHKQFVFFELYFLITLIMAFVSWKLLETPFNNLKKRFPYV
jgi:peptidoglycan/LPS O-acetylase OafA/YrhL